jgi:hypothetical protein
MSAAQRQDAKTKRAALENRTQSSVTISASSTTATSAVAAVAALEAAYAVDVPDLVPRAVAGVPVVGGAKKKAPVDAEGFILAVNKKQKVAEVELLGVKPAAKKPAQMATPAEIYAGKQPDISKFNKAWDPFAAAKDKQLAATDAAAKAQKLVAFKMHIGEQKKAAETSKSMAGKLFGSNADRSNDLKKSSKKPSTAKKTANAVVAAEKPKPAEATDKKDT